MAIDLKTLENLDSLSPEDKEAVLAEANEKYAQLQSATTKGIQTMNKAIEFNNSVDGDVEKIKAFNDANPEAAKIRLEKFRPGKTLEEVIAMPNDFDTRVNAIVEEKEVTKVIDGYVSQLPENLRDQFNAELKELSGDKKPTLKNVEKLVKAALAVISPSADEDTVARAKIAAIGAGGNKSGGTNQQTQKEAFENKIKEQSNEFLKNVGVL